jgi:AMP-binding enzyme
MIPDVRDYDGLMAAFRWAIPERYNIGVDVADRWARADPQRPAILDVMRDGRVDVLTFAALSAQSNRLANVLAQHGIARGDRVAVLLPQGAAVAVAHVAIYKLGAIALPLAILFGAEALRHRLTACGRQGPDHQRGWPRQGAADPAGVAGPVACDLDRRARRRRARLPQRARAGEPRVRVGRHRAGRPGADHLHVGHDRAA